MTNLIIYYKIIAKVVANRLKKVLPQIISLYQNAFFPGRLITDNILVAFEALRSMNVRKKGKEGYMALKLDMSKTYDRMKWTFLEEMMRKMGFAPRWIGIIMICVKTVSYSILINGKPYGHIKPTRGLHQADPLSPYLFIICAEGLSNLLRKAEMNREVSGFPISRGGVKISHLFFADDSLLFCRATPDEWVKMQRILEDYEKASGQRFNREKTSLFFSKNTPLEVRDNLKSLVGVNSTQSYEKYLGLPSLIGRSRVRSFKSIEGRIWERLNGWKEKFLTQAGKEVLLKVVIQAIPTFAMSVFQLPKVLCNKINSLMARFWWGHKDNLS
jgi:hypothetical protein